MKRYKIMRIPIEAWEGFYKKQQSMQDMVKNDLKWNNKKLHFTDVLKFFSQKQTIVFPDELAGYLNNKRRQRKFFPVTV